MDNTPSPTVRECVRVCLCLNTCIPMFSRRCPRKQKPFFWGLDWPSRRVAVYARELTNALKLNPEASGLRCVHAHVLPMVRSRSTDTLGTEQVELFAPTCQAHFTVCIWWFQYLFLSENENGMEETSRRMEIGETWKLQYQEGLSSYVPLWAEMPPPPCSRNWSECDVLALATAEINASFLASVRQRISDLFGVPR